MSTHSDHTPRQGRAKAARASPLRSRWSLPRPSRTSLFALIAALTLPLTLVASDPLEGYRERFQQGLDQFRAGNVSGAVMVWESIRGEVNDDTVYRLLFNLGKAYEVLGDATRAVERYSAFVDQADRRSKSESLPTTVVEERAEAVARLEELRRTRGRIRILASSPPRPVRVDGGEPIAHARTLYVAPGKHRVVVEPGSPHERGIDLDLKAGEEAEINPNPPAPAVPPSASAPAAPSARPVRPASVPPVITMQSSRPFHPVILVVAGGVTVASLLVPLLSYRRARGIYDEYQDPDTSINRREELTGQYTTARRTYALSWLVPAAFAAATGGLTLWYTVGTGNERAVQVAPAVGAGTLGAVGRF